MQSIGKILIITGAIAIIAGVVIYFTGNKLSWLGHLPGDIRIENENLKFYFPVTTMILVSIVASIAIGIFKKISDEIV